jgi:hypothetical protein
LSTFSGLSSLNGFQKELTITELAQPCDSMMSCLTGVLFVSAGHVPAHLSLHLDHRYLKMPKRPGSPLEPPGSSKLTKYFTKREAQSTTTVTTKSAPDAAIAGDPTASESAKIETKGDPLIDLSQLLSLGGLTTPEEVDARFETIANALFNDYRLKIHRVPKDDSGETRQSKDTYLQVMEMEFYLIMPGVHEDPFCHGSIEQEQSGIW